MSAINAALLGHKVIFFRGQIHLDDDGQLAFARLLGTPTGAHPTVTSRGDRILPIDSRYDKANSWHTDVTFVDRIPKASLLRAITMRPITTGATSDSPTAIVSTAKSSSPCTTRPSIRWCGSIPRRVSGYCCWATSSNSSSASAPLNRRSVSPAARVIKLENTIRWSWEPGDLAIWDNRATQHYAVADYDDQFRRLSRITLAGDIPVDVHGQHSRAIAGDASRYSEVVTPAALAS